MLAPWEKSYDQPRQHIKKQRHYFASKGPSSQSYGFSSNHVRMWELDYKESWALNNWCFWTVVLEKTLESPLDCKEIQPVHPKGNQSWIFIEGVMLKLKLQYMATWCEELTHWKRPWCWARLKAGGEGDNRGCDGWIPSPTNGHEFEQLGAGDGLGSLVCFSPWDCSVGHDWATELNWTEPSSTYILILFFFFFCSRI